MKRRFISIALLIFIANAAMWSDGFASERGEKDAIVIPTASLIKIDKVLTGNIAPVSQVDFCSDGKMLVVGDYEGRVVIWNIMSATLLRTLIKPKNIRDWPKGSPHIFYPWEGVSSVICSPDGGKAAVLIYDTITIWDIASDRNMKSIHSPESLSSIAFSRDGKMIAATDYSSSIFFWNVETGRKIKSLKVTHDKSKNEIGNITFSPDGRSFAVRRTDDVIVLDVAFKSERIIIPNITHDESFRSDGSIYSVSPEVVFSPDSSMLASGSEGHTVVLVDARTGKRIKSFKGHSEPIWEVLFSHDGGLLVSIDFNANT